MPRRIGKWFFLGQPKGTRMKLSYEQASELSEAIGTNWNLDLKWKEPWFKNMTRMIHATFKEFDADMVQRGVFQFILDSTSKQPPAFGELKAYLILKLGKQHVRNALENSSCQKCTDGTRRINVLVKIDYVKTKRMNFVARCMCERGLRCSTYDNIESFSMRLASPKAHVVFGYRSDDYHHIEVLEYNVSSWNPTQERQCFAAGVIEYELRTAEERQAGKEKMIQKNLEARKKQFRKAISRNKY